MEWNDLGHTDVATKSTCDKVVLGLSLLENDLFQDLETLRKEASQLKNVSNRADALQRIESIKQWLLRFT